MEIKMSFKEAKACPIQFVLALNDTLNVINGKWKLPIIGSLLFEKRRFTEIQRNIPKITPRMLSKELKDLEMNGMVKRTVYDTIPISVEYELTDSAKSLGDVLDKMLEWGLQHRENVLSGS
ncbi:helix-turn-helix domain-containing protein [Flavobacterium granuli]|jgi:DNA-binding HxlR family transcriptional regulator|uniref:DNA-binding HxlR family transcriptional regulator n=2 Tax=Flavobacterium TaxID=237 RepID=A0ABU1RZZ2_9FLAO|nr:helix-turn-helix domain-containing protein [Flavobacterium granuli]MDR6844334.1 DNA-binding HxlR family transcriptional regulator [Flavobacterium granuli]OOG78497.1 transcriptional regulator [Flavobacterium sp. A45]